MRGDNLGSPVLSTYAIGGDAPPPRRAGLALPVIVILGTASVAAIVSVSFDGETAIVADQRPKAGDPAPRQDAVERPAQARHAAVSVQFDDIPVAADDVPPAPAGKSVAQELPRLSVLQPRAPRPAARPIAAPRQDPPTRPAARPVRSAISGESVSPPPAADCLTDCGETEEFQPSAGPASNVALLDARLDEAAVPPGADELEEPVALDRTEPPASEVAVAAANEPADPGLLADSRPVVLSEPTGELVAGDANLNAPQLAVAGTPPVEVGGPPVESSEAGEEAAASFQRSAPAVSPPVDATEAGAGNTIPQHLARIGERYAAVPAAEPAAPAAPDPSAVGRDAAGAEHQAYAESSVALDLGETAGSGVIVQDDELVAIRLGELVSLLEDRFEHPLYVWMSSSSVASKFVTAETLAAAGIRTRYDPQRRQLVVSTTGE